MLYPNGLADRLGLEQLEFLKGGNTQYGKNVTGYSGPFVKEKCGGRGCSKPKLITKYEKNRRNP